MQNTSTSATGALSGGHQFQQARAASEVLARFPSVSGMSVAAIAISGVGGVSTGEFAGYAGRLIRDLTKEARWKQLKVLHHVQVQARGVGKERDVLEQSSEKKKFLGSGHGPKLNSRCILVVSFDLLQTFKGCGYFFLFRRW